MGNEAEWIIAGVTVLGMLGTMALQWTRYEGRLVEVKATAIDALQTAAEMENVHSELEEMIDTNRRDFGETGRAMQSKLTQMELWVRDNLVRKDSFKDVIDRIEKASEIRDARIERQLEAIFKRLDNTGGRQ